MKIQSYGWQPALPDQRDHAFASRAKAAQNVDLTSQMPPVFDQGQIGSCTANALAAAVQFELARSGRSKLDTSSELSRLFIYYNERAIEGTTRTDSGAQIRDGIKTLAKQGVCLESTWPYVVSAFAKKPNGASYKTALKDIIHSYERITTAAQRLNCLAGGSPFTLGFTVYDSFESDEVAKSGVVPMPEKGEKVLGGHAVVAVGYDQGKQVFICRNSWGTGWGMKGYFTIPFAYINNANLSDDHWTIRS